MFEDNQITLDFPLAATQNLELSENGNKTYSLHDRNSDIMKRAPTASTLMRQQSIMDPDDPKVLMNYDLDQFNNSIWENFMGSQI